MNHLVGVDVGSCYVKVVEGSEKNNRIHIRKIGYFPNPFAEFKKNLVEREQDVFVKTFKEFLHKHGIQGKNAAGNIGGSGAILHYFDIPNLPANEIKPAVQLELMQATPGGIKNLEYDYLLLPGKNGGKTVLFVGYPKDRCEFFTNALHRAGLKPLIIDHDSLAVFNCFTFLNKKQSGPVFILDIGDKTANFVLAEENNGFILIRDIPFGNGDLTGTIAKQKGISVEEARIYLSKKENTDEVKKILSGDLEDLLSEVTAGMEYFKTRTGKSPERLFLTGGFSTIPGMCESFEQNIKIKTAAWNPLEQMANDKTLLLPEEIKKKGPLFAVSLGLALRKIK